MRVTSALQIGPAKTVNTLIRTSCHLPAGSESLCISIESEQDREKLKHADCTLRLNDIQKCIAEWERVGFLLSLRMKHLQNPGNSNTTLHLPGSMLYKGFSPLINYDEEYRCTQQFAFDPDSSEGYGVVKFQTDSRGSPRQNPYWIDIFVQFASLILHFNSSTNTNDKGVQYALNGWDSLRIVKELSCEQSYSIYGRMTCSIENNISSGDIYLFEGDKIVASCFGISFLENSRIPSTLPSTPRSQEVDSDNNSSLGLRTPDSIKNSNFQHDNMSRKVLSEKGSNWQKSSSSPGSNLEENVLAIISQEVSTDITEVEEDTAFSDLSVDSLLSMSIVDESVAKQVFVSQDLSLSLTRGCQVSSNTYEKISLRLQTTKADGDLSMGHEQSDYPSAERPS